MFVCLWNNQTKPNSIRQTKPNSIKAKPFVLSVTDGDLNIAADGYIIAPNYKQNHYPRSQDVNWTIKADQKLLIEVTIEEIHLKV